MLWLLAAEIEAQEWGWLAVLGTVLSVLTGAIIKFWPVRAKAAREAQVTTAKLEGQRIAQEARIKKDVYEQVREHYEEVFEQQRTEIEQQRLEVKAQRERTEKLGARLEGVYGEIRSLYEKNAVLLIKNEQLLGRVAVLEATLDRFRTQANVAEVATMNDAIIVANDRGIIRQWNEAATVLLHWRKEEALGQRVDIIIPPEQLELHNRAWQEVRETGRDVRRGPHQFIALTKDGQRVAVDALLSSWREGERRMFSASMRKAIVDASGKRLSEMPAAKELAAAATSILEDSGVLSKGGQQTPPLPGPATATASEEVDFFGESTNVVGPKCDEQGGR